MSTRNVVILIRWVFVLFLFMLSACGGQDEGALPPPLQENDVQNHAMNMGSSGSGIEEDLPDLPGSEEDALDDRKRVMILVKPGVKPESVILEYGGVVEQSYGELNMATGKVAADQIEKMQQDSRIVHLEIDKPVEVKPAQIMDWGRVDVQVPNAISSNFTGKGIKIAVVDTGISPHDDLVIAGGISMVDYTTSYHDDNGHGTHVAGIIAAQNNDFGVVGVAPDSQIYAVKVLGDDGTGYLSDVIAGIDWGIQQHIDVINLSLGSSTPSVLMESIINQAANHNIVVVSASGNEGTATGTEDNVNYPARYENAVGVGAVDDNDTRAYFSSTGAEVELAAPGVGILSTYLDNSYAKMDGTSSATPFVSGIVALLKQNNPSITLPELRKVLQKASIDLGVAGRDTWYGFGLAQAPYYFKDIYGHWARIDILTAYENKWMIGLPDQHFYPNRVLTRAEGATILVRMLDLVLNPDSPMPFTDVPDSHWAFDAIRTVFQEGLMNGVNQVEFNPDASLTREEMAAVLARVLQPETAGTVPFTDIPPTSWSYPAVASLYVAGIVKGIDATTFAPIKSMTRAEMATMLNRISPQLKETETSS